ncbi:MAG: hypothetical protein QM754_17790 [Tepidisphaeraceae bacterium]
MVSSKLIKTFAGALVVGLLCRDALAWGSKEHILLTNLAAQRVIADPTAPEELKAFLKANCPDLGTPESLKDFFINGRVGVTKKDAKGMTLWCIEPDNRSGDKETKVPPFGVNEQMLHFVDMEYLHTDIDKQVYKHDLSSAVDITTVPRDMADPRFKKAGMLPFAVEYSFKKLVTAIQADKLGFTPGENSEDNALVWSGRLAHYLEDNTQPLHNTEDYKAQSYFADKRSAPNIHSEMEYRMNDDEKFRPIKLRTEYWDLLAENLKTFKDPADEKDLWKGTLEVSAASYKQIPLIGLAAMNAAGQAGTPDKPTGPAKKVPDTEKFFRFTSDVTGTKESVMQMKARQQAWAVVRVAEIWKRAWVEAKAK